MAPHQNKIAAMLNWAVPTSIKKLRGLLGLSWFYRRFIKIYASIAFALMELLKKDLFAWSVDAQNAFDTLKIAMT